MITEKELQINNKSYTNKDFASIYQEIIELAKKLSYKFDPETSNESDPFVVLLKLLAFIGDKTNYNIDKNILERFMPSATQETSMRNLCEMMGYNMHYYITPETTISLKYVGSDDNIITTFENSGSITIPKFSVFSNNSRDVNFILTDNIIVDSSDIIFTGKVKQGTLKTLTVLGDEKIQLENLDDNNRIYFPETMVAENGIFIDGGNLPINDSQ